MSLRSSASRPVVSTLDISIARRAADVWKAREIAGEFLAAYTSAVAYVRNKDRGRSIKGAYYRYAVHPTTMGQLQRVPRG